MMGLVLNQPRISGDFKMDTNMGTDIMSSMKCRWKPSRDSIMGDRLFMAMGSPRKTCPKAVFYGLIQFSP